MSKKLKQAQLSYALTKSYIVQRAPYIAKTVYGFIPHYIPDLRKIARGPIGVTKGLILLMDLDWIISLTPEQFGGPIYHEVFHQVKDHLPRIDVLLGKPPDDSKRYTANIAADFTINPWLIEHDWWLPDFAVHPKDYGMPNDWMLEEYFTKLLALPKKEECDEGTFAAGACGGCAGNFIAPELEAELDAQKGRGEADVIRIRNETILEINEHIKQSGIGTVPGGFHNLIPFVKKESIVPWREELDHIVCNAFETVISGSDDFSLRRPSKRSYTRGIIRPGLIAHQPEIVLIEDTSGSMGTKEIQSARNEEVAVLEALGIQECWYIQADADLAIEPKRINLYDIPELKTHGRGGTDFRPALEAIQNLDPRPDLALYLTDGYGPAPEEPPPGIEVVWVLIPEGDGVRPAEWGHLVIVSDDPKTRARYGEAA